MVHHYNDLNQLLSDGTKEYAYDLLGNLSKHDDVEYRYDALGRLIEVEKPHEVTKYIYDAMNRRLSKETFGKSQGTLQLVRQEKYLYTGQNEIGAYENNHIKELRVLGVGKGAEIGATVLIELNDKAYVPLHDQNGT